MSTVNCAPRFCPNLRSTLAAAAASVAVAAMMFVGVAPPALAGAESNNLQQNEQLNPGQRLVTSSGIALIMQGDGNLVEYAPGNRVVWASNTNRAGSILRMQGDGNLVIIAPGNAPVWNTNTGGNAGAGLELQNDGNAVVYAQGHIAKWANGAQISGSSNPRAEAAINWFLQRQGSTSYEGMCEKAVENAYGTTGRYSTARANWNSRPQRSPYNAAPRGALVFYNTSSAGHVAISLGDGRVVSTSANGRIGIVPIGYFQRPLGWADSPW